MSAAAATPATAQDSVAQFYKGRQMTVLVGSSAGGGYDIYARLLARHMGKYIPGNPSMIVTNMPGAASNAAVAHLYNVAPKDGTFIGAPQNSAIMDALFDSLLGNARRLRHDVTKLIHVGSATTDHYVCIARADAPVKSFKEALTKELLIGASQTGTSTRDYPAMLNNMTGAKIKQVSGYPGTREITLAIEKNEVQGLCGFSWSSLNAQKPDWVKSGFVRVIVQEHDKGNPDVNKMGVPLAVDFATSPENRRIMELVYSSQTFGRPYLLAPGHSGGAGRGAAQGVHGDHEGPRASGGGPADRACHRSDLRRGPAGPGREDFRDTDGFRREDQGRAGLSRAVDAAVTDRACGAPPPAPRPCRGPGRR